MSTNRFFYAVEPQKLEECLQNQGDIHEFLQENTLKYADTSFTPVYRTLQDLIQHDKDFSQLDYPSFQPNKNMDLDYGGTYRFNIVPDIYEVLSQCDFSQKADEYGADLEEWVKKEIISCLTEIFEVFKYANEHNLSVVSYIG